MTQDEPETEILDFDNPTYKFEPNSYHKWVQQGPYLICMSCEIKHAQFVGMNKIMTGIKEDGTPILEKR